MPITPEQLEAAFSSSKEVFNGEKTSAAAINELNAIGLNKNTAQDFINQYKWLRLGQGSQFKRTMSRDAFRVFLTRIFEDDGSKALEVALAAAWDNVEYYEKTHGRMASVRQLLESMANSLAYTLIYKDFKLSIRQIGNDIQVTDEKIDEPRSSYKIKNRSLDQHSELIQSFVETCLRHGFNWALQIGHPREEYADYLSFGVKYGNFRPSWDVCANDLTFANEDSFVIEKRHINTLMQHQVPFQVESRNTQNLLVSKVSLENALEAIAFEYAVDGAVADSEVEEPAGNEKPASKESTSSVYERDPMVKGWVLANSGGKCECCGNPAPFETEKGPYLEVHHLLQLAFGGPDTIHNCVAVCPNCHRNLHYGKDAGERVADLTSRISRLKGGAKPG